MKKQQLIRCVGALGMAVGMCLSMAACSNMQNEPTEASLSALPVKALNPKQVEENPYISKNF